MPSGIDTDLRLSARAERPDCVRDKLLSRAAAGHDMWGVFVEGPGDWD